jgi:hypothetical protein
MHASGYETQESPAYGRHAKLLRVTANGLRSPRRTSRYR